MRFWSSAVSGIVISAVMLSSRYVQSEEPHAPVKIDQESGLFIADGYEIVKENCQACHSLAIVLQNRADRETWLNIIRWMQKKQGLWEFKPEVEKKLLDYLSTNYSPVLERTGEKPYRRPNLPESLLPAE